MRYPTDPDWIDIAFRGVRRSGEEFVASRGARRVDRWYAERSEFQSCRFEGYRIDRMSFGEGPTPTVYRDCVFRDMRMRMQPGGTAVLEGCTFEDVQISDWFTSDTAIMDCVFSGRIRHSNIGARSFRDREGPGVRIESNDFSNCELIDTAFVDGVNLERQTLPTGPQYIYITNARHALRTARDTMVATGNPDDHAFELSMLQSFNKRLQGEQDQLFKNFESYALRDRPRMERLLRLIQASADH